MLWEGRAHGARLSTRLPAGEGPLGGVVRSNAPLRLHGQLRQANHYADETRPGALLAVPLRSQRGGHLRGVVLADRLADEPFGDEEERLLSGLAAELARAATAERIIREAQALRQEKEGFHAAIEAMNRASTPRQVFDALLASAARVAQVDFGAVTLVEGEGEHARHQVVRAASMAAAAGEALAQPEGAGAELEGKAFPANGGLVSCAVRLGSSLPGRPLRPEDAVVFDDGTRLRGLASIKVLPLRAGERVLGTLVVGARRAAAFQGDVVRQLEVVALQAGDTLLRAQLFEATERLATTDGLTGLLNHRTFQERLERAPGRGAALRQAALAPAHRRRPLQGGERHLRSPRRATRCFEGRGPPPPDRGARHRRGRALRRRGVRPGDAGDGPGGSAASSPSASARRWRARPSPPAAGQLRVTISLGVASFPNDGDAKPALIEVADGGLYHAKRHGRNQTVALSRVRARQGARGSRS